MSEPYVGEIRMFAGNFAPRSWALCDGQLLAIGQNDALFSLLGTIYGGDGRTTFGLPDLRGRIPLHMGTGPGLSARAIGAKSGAETATLTPAEMPAHTHQAVGSAGNGADPNPAGNHLASSTVLQHYVNEPVDTDLAATSVTNLGGGQAHTNLMPTLCVNFIIALFGIYPSRT